MRKAKTTARKRPTHSNNVFSLLAPAMFVSFIAALSVPTSIFLIHEGDMKLATFAVGGNVFLAVLTIVAWLEGIFRVVEYDRLAAELDRINVSSILSIKIDALLNKFYATYRRREVFALGISTLKKGPPYGEAYAWVNEALDTRSERLPMSKPFTKDWWKNTFSAVNLLT